VEEFDLEKDLIEAAKEIIFHEKQRVKLEAKTIEELEVNCQMCGSQRCSGGLPEAKGCMLYEVMNRKRGE